jgi:hypothetical protein
MTSPTTWQAIRRLEPALAKLEADIRLHATAHKNGKPYCANDHWYGRFKERLCHLVGFQARNPALRTMEAYDLVYRKLYRLLPDCRHESPIC